MKTKNKNKGMQFFTHVACRATLFVDQTTAKSIFAAYYSPRQDPVMIGITGNHCITVRKTPLKNK